MVEDTAKKPKVGQGEDSEHVDGELVLSVEKLQELQDELEKVNEEASDKVLEMEQKYNELRKPVYVRRNEIIKSIPDFWLTAFLSHPTLSDVLNEEDQKIFKYIDSLVVEDFKDMKFGFSIHLTFKENPFFENTKLTKTFAIFEDEGTTTVTGTPFKWKEGMGAANGDHETKGNKRSFDDQSFFSWFSEAEQKFFALYSDEVAEVIKDDIWPNPLKYFNNDADEEDSDGQEDEDNGDDNGDEDDGKEES